MFKHTKTFIVLLLLSSLLVLVPFIPVMADERFVGYSPEWGDGDSYDYGEDQIWFQNYTCPQTGFIDSLFFKLRSDAYTLDVEVAVYDSAGNILVEGGPVTMADTSGSYEWTEFTLDNNITVTEGEDYYFSIWGESGSGILYIRWDNSESYVSKTASKSDVSEVYGAGWETDMADFDLVDYSRAFLVYAPYVENRTYQYNTVIILEGRITVYLRQNLLISALHSAGNLCALEQSGAY